MPIYTRTGDDGTTSLYGGKRVLKCEELVDVYGSMDELNSWMGLITVKAKSNKSFLLAIQSDLFTIGSTLAGWKGNLRSVRSRIAEMEKHIDQMDSQLPKRTHFIVPGGSELAAQIHIARSICRRVERQTVALSKKQDIHPVIIQYLNRLSDLLFMLARFINMQGKVRETVWSGIPKSKEKRKLV
jgi:cob(I)alamin adenosyltransferase